MYHNSTEKRNDWLVLYLSRRECYKSWCSVISEKHEHIIIWTTRKSEQEMSMSLTQCIHDECIG